MRKNWLLLSVLAVSGCLTNTPDPELGGIYACVAQDDCPGTLSCLQKVCEEIVLPHVEILNPEDGKPYTAGTGTAHAEILNVAATDFILRPRSQSNDKVLGEGHLVVFVDEAEVGMIDSGDLSAGVQMPIEIPDEPGVHRVRVQARFNDGTNYDNEDAVARTLVWVNNGKTHVALRIPWPGDTFPVEVHPINAEVAVFDPSNTVSIGPPMTGVQHVHVFYDETFPDCIDDPSCFISYEGIVPSNENTFGPVILPSAGAGPVKLTAVMMLSDHTVYRDAEMNYVFSSIEILRTNQ
jgi:hypothetical protein